MVRVALCGGACATGAAVADHGKEMNGIMELNGRVAYAFGDSVINGHVYPRRACMEFVGERTGLVVRKFARNGATILPQPLKRPDLGGQVYRQLDEVPDGEPAPDVIVFNGGINDAWPARIPARLGDFDAAVRLVEGGGEPVTFADWFVATILRMRRTWPDAKLLYVAVARTRAREWDIQLMLRDVEMRACAHYGVGVADVFADADLDTRRDADRVAYTFDELGADGLPSTPQTARYDDPTVHPDGVHPNFPAIERFYAPVIIRALERL